MFNKLEHIGIAVNDLSVSIPIFEKLFNSLCYKTETVESENVITAFFLKDNTKIELLQGLTPDSIINRYIEKRGEGLHHIAFEFDDLPKEIERLKKEGFIFINESPKKGADNKLICFLHPKSTNGILIELCQSI